MSSTIDAYLKALLALSGNPLLAEARKAIADKDLSKLAMQGMSREFARGGLEEIVSVILDVIARDPGSDDNRDAGTATFKNEGVLGKKDLGRGKPICIRS